jgi:hypothetical protein
MRNLTLGILLVSSMAWGDAGVSSGVNIVSVFDGQGGTAQGAPDVGGSTGAAYVLDAVSGSVTVRDLGGHVIATRTADAFWSAAGVAGTPKAFAQRAIYDFTRQRWYMSAEEATSGTPNRIYVAISESSDPTGAWKAVTLPAQGEVIANTHLAIDGVGVYLTGEASDHGFVLALPIADLAWTTGGGPSAAHLNVISTPSRGLVPASNSFTTMPSAPTELVARSVLANSNTSIDLYTLTWSGAIASLGPARSIDLGSSFPLPTRHAVQGPPAPALDPGDGSIASAMIVDSGVIAGIATTELSGRLAAFWFEIRPDATLAATGTITDYTDLLAPSIALSPDVGRPGPTIGFVLTSVSPGRPPAIVVTGVPGNTGELQPLTTTRSGDAAYACTASSIVAPPFGRYSSIQSDGLDGFWAVAQFGASATDCEFGTAWVNFRIISPPDGYPGDGAAGADDLHTSAGCGCRSHDGSATIVWSLLVSIALRRRRSIRGTQR